MIDCESLPGRLREICDGTARHSNGKKFTLSDRAILISKRLRREVYANELPLVNEETNGEETNNKEPRPVLINSNVGDNLLEIIKRDTDHGVPCSACKREISRLNTMTAGQVLNEIDDLAKRIVERSKDNAQTWYQRTAATYLPGMVAVIVKDWIREACMRKNSGLYRSMNWEWGITTVPSRSEDLFPRTLESLMNAGFENPRLFIDNCPQQQAVDVYGHYNLAMTSRDHIRTAGNWVLSMYELWIRNPHAQRYAIFQDDFVTIKNLRRYLEIVEYPAKGYQNLYTFPQEQVRATGGGWYASNQRGLGAVALVFSNEAVKTLLGQMYLVDRFLSKDRGHRAIDGGIVDAMKTQGWKEYVHNPSLVQHIGDVSSMGSAKHPKAKSFPGENFDALELLKIVPTV